jgi:signal transduction histidine kinase/ligand-binding sensor domain-containing protein
LCAAPAAFSVRTWQIPDGSTNTVFGVAQSPDGFLWAGTTAGLSEFDGVTFRTHLLGAPLGLSDSRVRMLLTSRGGGLWVALDGAVVLLRTNQPPIVVKDNVPPQRVETMVEDNDGALWLGLRGGPICRVRDGKATIFDSKDRFPDASISLPSLAVDTRGRVWLARGEHLGIIENEHYIEVKQMPSPCFICGASSGGLWVCSNFKLHKYEDDEMEPLAALPVNGHNEVLKLFEDHTGTLWVGTSSNGLFRFAGTAFENIPTPQAQITCLTEDREGNLWLGSDSGLDRVSPCAIETEGTESGLPLGAVRSICQAPDGRIWAVMANSSIMTRMTDTWSPAPFKLDDSAYCITADNTGSIWIGSPSRHLYRWKSGQLQKWDSTDGVEGHVITALLAARNGNIWIGSTSASTLQCFRNGQFVNFKMHQGNGQVDAMVEDSRGNVWVGRSGRGGLLRITDDRVVDETPAGDDWPVHALLLMPDETLWIAVYSRGLARMKAGNISMITPEQGLAENHISQILSDGHGWLWLGTDSGIFKTSQRVLDECADGKRSSIQCIRCGSDAGLPPLQARYGQCPDALCSSDGRLWFSMATALAIVIPQRVRAPLPPPSIVLQQVLIDDEVRAHAAGYFSTQAKLSGTGAADALRLEPGYHHLEFDFTAPSFSSPEDTRFRYRLEPFEDTWSEITSPRKAIYPRLTSGEYRFHVIGSNADGTWNDQGTAMLIRIRPFFWQTWWFILIASLSVIGTLLLIIRYVALRRLRRRLQLLEQRSALDRERARIARDIHDDLGHGLTQIVLLSDIDSDEQLPSDELTGQLKQIAATAKQGIKSLDETVWAINPRNDTLPDVVDYLGEFVVQSVRAAGMRCELDLPDHPPVIPVPSEVRHNLFLAVKEAVNNSLRHANAGKVILKLTTEAQTIQICVADDGIGFDPDRIHHHNGDGQHDGLRNMRQRMLDIGGAFELETRAGAGTRVVLTLDLGRLNHNHVPQEPKADSYADHRLHR